MTSVVHHEVAEDELLEEVGYLELLAKGLGPISLQVQRVETLIGQLPHSTEEIRPGIRNRVLRQFRYSITNLIENDVLLILAKAHDRRRPHYWLNRVKKVKEDTEVAGK